jgi:hypothetical protein
LDGAWFWVWNAAVTFSLDFSLDLRSAAVIVVWMEVLFAIHHLCLLKVLV